MGRTATIIAVFYSSLAVVSVLIVLAVWRSTRSRARGADTARLARLETSFLGIAMGLLLALLFATIFFAPYGESAGAGEQVVGVSGFQFGWTIEPQVVKANVPVEFQLTALDVNHGFGVYNDDEELLFQAQVVPERTQNVVHTFKKPGRYQVLCLEFCGFAHELMRATFEVRP